MIRYFPHSSYFSADPTSGNLPSVTQMYHISISETEKEREKEEVDKTEKNSHTAPLYYQLPLSDNMPKAKKIKLIVSGDPTDSIFTPRPYNFFFSLLGKKKKRMRAVGTCCTMENVSVRGTQSIIFTLFLCSWWGEGREEVVVV